MPPTEGVEFGDLSVILVTVEWVVKRLDFIMSVEQ